MTYIKSPFNFVPVSKNVYFPDWAEQISHDVPFSDGISGVIHLKIKNRCRLSPTLDCRLIPH